MDEPRARGVSLWLTPDGEARDRLGRLIARLAERLATPPFVPHVTLLPGIEGPEQGVLETARELASGLAPLRLSLRSIEGREDAFRCLIAVADSAEPLQAAHAAAARAFGREPDPAFLPHLSLVYGALEPEPKRSLARELAGEMPVVFESSRLHAWRTEGAVADWFELGAFRLASGRR